MNTPNVYCNQRCPALSLGPTHDEDQGPCGDGRVSDMSQSVCNETANDRSPPVEAVPGEMSDWLLIEFPPQRCHEAKAGSVNELDMTEDGYHDDSRYGCFETA